MFINFDKARTLAYKTLLEQEHVNLKVNALDIAIPDKAIIFDTIQNYSQITGKTISELTCGNKKILGFNIAVGRGTHIILHNENIALSECINWTRMHEIGHIKYEHEVDDAKEEIETNFFSSCTLIPDAVISAFLKYKMKIDAFFITNYFNVSPAAATKKISTLNKYFPRHKYDNDIIRLFESDIETILTNRGIIAV